MGARSLKSILVGMMEKVATAIVLMKTGGIVGLAGLLAAIVKVRIDANERRSIALTMKMHRIRNQMARINEKDEAAEAETEEMVVEVVAMMNTQTIVEGIRMEVGKEGVTVMSKTMNKVIRMGEEDMVGEEAVMNLILAKEAKVVAMTVSVDAMLKAVNKKWTSCA